MLTPRVSMSVTTLPDPRKTCERISANVFTTVALHRCGDCMFSGHALMLTIACLYWMRLSSMPGVVFSLLALAGGIAAIVANHTHYTVDVVVAVYTAVGVWFTVSHVLAAVGWSGKEAGLLLPYTEKAARSPLPKP